MDDLQEWYSADAATFGDRVAAARDHAGMSQKELAKRLGIRASTLRAWEDDRNEPRANRLSMLAGVLNVSMMWLINGEGDGLADTSSDDGDLNAVLAELRTLRTELALKAEQAGKLEKRLRTIIQDMQFDGTS